MRPEKQILLEEIKEKIEGSKAIIVTSYEKLQPEISWRLNQALFSEKALFEVVKKRIFAKAMQESGIPVSLGKMKGHIGIVFVNGDIIESAKALYGFNRNNESILEILSGQLEGKYYSSSDIKMLSELPTQDQMRSQFLGLLEAPMSQTLSVMENILTSVMHCLENKSKKNKK